MRTRALVLCLALLVSACASLGMHSFQEPSITLNAITVRSLGLAGGTLDVALDVDNPNQFELRGTRLEMGLDVEGTHFGDVVFTDPFALPRGQTTTVVVPLTFEWAGVGVAARSVLNYGSVKYQMHGTASVTTPFGTGKVPFSRDGAVSLTK
ncbi:MAG: LEA type 2 family protein [Gemmatimonadales bacterium]